MTAVAHPRRTFPRPIRAYHAYSEAELIFVNQWAGILSYALLGKIMDRSANSVANIASFMALTHGSNIPAFIVEQRLELRELERRLKEPMEGMAA